MQRVEDSDAWQPLVGRIGTVDLGADPSVVRADLEAVRVFAGYSGWGPGQLDDELRQEGWFVVDPLPDDLLTERPRRAVAAGAAAPGWRAGDGGQLPRDIESN